MKKITKLLVLPLFALLAAYDSSITAKPAFNPIEDTQAHDELFFNEPIKFENNFDPVDTTTGTNDLTAMFYGPRIAVQTSPVVDGKVNIRFIAAINADFNMDKTVTESELDSISITWHRALYAANGEVIKPESEKASSIAYTAINTGGGTPFTIADYNATLNKNDTKYTHFVTYALRGIPYNTYKDAYITNYCTVSSSEMLLGSTSCDSRASAVRVDLKNIFTFDPSDSGFFGVKKTATGYETVASSSGIIVKQNENIKTFIFEAVAGDSFLTVYKDTDTFKVFGYSDEALGHNVFAQDGQSEFMKVNEDGFYMVTDGNHGLVNGSNIYLHKCKKYEIRLNIKDDTTWKTDYFNEGRGYYAIMNMRDEIDNAINVAYPYTVKKSTNNTYVNTYVPLTYTLDSTRAVSELEANIFNPSTGKLFATPEFDVSSIGGVYTSLTDTWTNLETNFNLINDDTKGEIVYVQGSGYNGETITITVVPNEGYEVLGIVDKNGNIAFAGTLTTKATYNSSSGPYTVVYGSSSDAKNATVPVVINNTAEQDAQINKLQVKYGIYPQSNVNDPTIVAALNSISAPEANGYYLYNGEYYAKTTANPSIGDDPNNYDGDPIVLSNGETIIKGNEYWFKCEPIVWDIKSSSTGKCRLVAHNILDIRAYKDVNGYNTTDTTLVHYDTSDVRAWLTTTFYASAFGLNDSHINNIEVDNSESSGSISEGVCGNTQDKVFLPSKNDISGWKDAARIREITDYALVKGAHIETNNARTGHWLTRTPGHYDPVGMYTVEDDGTLVADWRTPARRPVYFVTAYCGIVPSIDINFF